MNWADGLTRKRSKVYWAWRWWMRWFCPLPILLKISKRIFGNSHVWYQDEQVNLELRGRRDPHYDPLKLRALIVHMQIHSGYPNNGYLQMTTEEKALYDAINADSERILGEQL